MMVLHYASYLQGRVLAVHIGARNGPALDVKAHVLEVKVACKFGKFDIKPLILFE